MQFYLAAGAGDTLPRGRFRPVRAIYRLGPRLLSAAGNAPVQGGLMLVRDSRECGPAEVLARDILRECLRRNYDGVVLDWYHNSTDRGSLTAQMGQLCTQYERRLFVPERYASHAPHATVLLNTAVSGVAYNISKALKTLGDDVTLLTMTGRDFPAEYIQSQLCTAGIGTDWVKPRLKETPNSVVLYDGEGKRQIYCDLKDIQETPYDFPEDICRDADVVAACNINFNRPLLHQAKTLGKTVATDVHVLSDIHDEFNREFMSCADILFLSDEGIRGDYRDFLRALGDTYGNRIIVLGRGAEGAAMYLREESRIFALPAVQVGEIVNTVGAGDALFSGFLHHFARGYRPLDALARAQVFASAKIRVSGAANGFPAEEEMESLCREYTGRMEYYEV